ncbi:MAG TPA: P-II family nitrogen regulator [Acidimicrobiia bacterium]|nr:P-II family nitrogen regulator [Acidimicrobiia bacterium]
MKRIEGIFRPDRLQHVTASLDAAGVHGFTIADARGHGRAADKVGEWRGVPYEMMVTHKLVITIFVDDDEVQTAVRAIARGASTGELGDGFVAVSDLAAVYQIRSVAANGNSA